MDWIGNDQPFGFTAHQTVLTRRDGFPAVLPRESDSGASDPLPGKENSGNVVGEVPAGVFLGPPVIPRLIAPSGALADRTAQENLVIYLTDVVCAAMHAEAPFALQLHTHGSGSEGRASMYAQDYMAAETGFVDGIWWTEHGFRLVNYAKIESVAFSGLDEEHTFPTRDRERAPGTTTISSWWERVDPDDAPKAMAEITASRATTGETSLYLTVPGRDDRATAARWGLRADNYRERMPLFSRPKIDLAVYPSGMGCPFLELVLSEQPPDLSQPRLVYTFGADVSVPVEGDRCVRRTVDVTADRWNRVSLEPAADAEALDLPGEGLDNALYQLRLGVRSDGEPAGAWFDDLRIEPAFIGKELVDIQRELLEELPTRVEHFPGIEISWYGQHVNAFGGDVPVPDYADRDPDTLDTGHVVKHIIEHGGEAGYNHPATSDLDDHAERLIREAAYGVAILEIGRRAEPVADRLELWDRLGEAGVAVTGVGVGDTHHAGSGWVADHPADNWWVTKVWADACKLESLLAGLRAGRAFFARPQAFDGTMEIKDEAGLAMGDATVTTDAKRLTADLAGGTPGDMVRWICNGEELTAEPIAAADASIDVTVPAKADVRGVRWELYRDYEDREEPALVGASNPVYLVSERAQLRGRTATERFSG